MRSGLFAFLLLPAMLAAWPAAADPVAKPVAPTVSDRERFDWEKASKTRELNISNATQQTAANDLQFRRDQAKKQKWANPLYVAIVGATIAALASLGVALVNAKWQRDADARKAESDRILKMIETGDPATAVRNLRLLVEAKLVTSEPLRGDLETYVKAHENDATKAAFLPRPSLTLLQSGTGLPGGRP